MFISKIIILLSVLFLYNCSASYKEISKKEFKSQKNLSSYLFNAYKEKADFEALEMHDWNSAKLYSEKAIEAINGKEIFPQKISYWKIPAESKFLLIKAHDNLMAVYEDALLLNPYSLAKAITSLDCWSEQLEEKWQMWDINQCRDDFLNALHNIYNNIAENKKNLETKLSAIKSEIKNDSASLVTEDKEKNILQIVFFDFEKSNLTSVSINEIKNFIKENQKIIHKFIIIGHTDTMGKKKYNQKLSLERANAVKDILIKIGVDNENIKVVGKGEENLAYYTEDETPHPLNRRAEISPLN